MLNICKNLFLDFHVCGPRSVLHKYNSIKLSQQKSYQTWNLGFTKLPELGYHSMFSIFCVRIPGEEGSELMTEAPERIEVKPGEEGADPEVVEHEQLLAALSG
jgi:hypothetical protein